MMMSAGRVAAGQTGKRVGGAADRECAATAVSLLPLSVFSLLVVSPRATLYA